MFQIFMFESVLKISEHVEIWNACWKHIEKDCLKLYKNMLKFSACSENCKKACWKFQYVLKTVKKHVENFRMFWKL